MENDVLDALSDIGYEGPLLELDALEKALEGGPKSSDYSGLVHTLSTELKDLCRLEEAVNETAGPEDASHFVLELSSFLKELGCPYLSLVTGHMSSRLQNRSDKLLLLDYLLSELMAARMLAVDKPNDIDTSMDVTIQETPTAMDLNSILAVLKMTQPPANIATNLLFTKLKDKLRGVVQQRGSEFVGHPLYNQAVNEKQWKELEELHQRLVEEYKLRREMLITRLDCTIQSFEWKGGKGNAKNNKLQAVYRPLRDQMKVQSSIKLSDFLAARTSLLAMRKTSDAAVRINTRSEVNKVVIGRVPDRGGRPSEQQPPPPEMPSWVQQRSQGGGGRGGGQGGRGGRGGGQMGRGGGSGFGGGNRVQGGWNQPMDQREDQRGGRNQGFQDNRGGQSGYQSNNRGNNYQDNGRGNYQDKNQGDYQGGNRGGYQDNRGGYQDNNRGGHQDNNRGGYQDNNRGGHQDNSRGGYQDNNRGGYQDNNRGGYQENNRGNYQNNRNSRGGYQDNQETSSYAGSKTYVVQNEQNQSQGYQSNQGYQQSNPGYQTNQGYQQSNQGYQSNRGGGVGSGYRNEHDDRTSANYNRGGSGRGRSSYNRGGRQ